MNLMVPGLAEITIWVRQSAFEEGLDPILFSTVKDWISKKCHLINPDIRGEILAEKNGIPLDKGSIDLITSFEKWDEAEKPCPKYDGTMGPHNKHYQVSFLFCVLFASKAFSTDAIVSTAFNCDILKACS